MIDHLPALDFLEFETTVLSTHPDTEQNHQFQWFRSVEGQQQVRETAPVVPQQSRKLYRLVFVGEELEAVGLADDDGAVTAFLNGEDRL